MFAQEENAYFGIYETYNTVRYVSRVRTTGEFAVCRLSFIVRLVCSVFRDVTPTGRGPENSGRKKKKPKIPE